MQSAPRAISHKLRARTPSILCHPLFSRLDVSVKRSGRFWFELRRIYERPKKTCDYAEESQRSGVRSPMFVPVVRKNPVRLQTQQDTVSLRNVVTWLNSGRRASKGSVTSWSEQRTQ